MQFLPYQFPYVGSGMLIGLNAIVHVLVSHGFAIGAMSMVVLAEYLGLRHSDPAWDNFGKRLLKVTIIAITSLGAMTGVGIWFSTSVVAPRAIGSLLRIFYWPWFAEWIVFALEVIVILTYYFTWDRAQGSAKRNHLRLGMAYVMLSGISACIICGILGFMLTPGRWPWDQNLTTAYFNATFLPQLLLRGSLALALGAIFTTVFLMVNRWEAEFERRALRTFGRVLVLTLPCVLGLGWWYFAAIPARLRTFAIYSVLGSRWSDRPELFWFGNLIAASMVAALATTLLAGSRLPTKLLIAPSVLAAICLVAEFERIREFIRGPYLIPGYMYANQVLLDEVPYEVRKGMLDQSYWYATSAAAGRETTPGEYLFAQNCAACHTTVGINGIAQRVAGRSRDGIRVIIGHTHEMIPFMPPFSGTADERSMLADYLFDLSRRASTASRTSPFALSPNIEGVPSPR